MTALQKAIATLAVIVLMALVVLWGVRQYGNSRVATQALETTEKAVSGAVAARESAVSTDASQAAQKAVLVDSVRSAIIQAKGVKPESTDSTRSSSTCGCVNLGMLNRAIGEANRAIAASAELPE